jgi:hypothetical protein
MRNAASDCDEFRRTPTIGIRISRAYVTAGEAAAALPSSVMKSRLFTQ